MNATHQRSSLKSFLPLKAAILAVVVVLVTLPGSARADIWCLRDFGSGRQTCVFGSASQCTSAAVIAGGICEREALGRTAASKPCPPRVTQTAKGRRGAGTATCDAS